ncbi:MAG: diguanylate cyclase domain-containing protein [Thermomicrobiales bacterium]
MGQRFVVNPPTSRISQSHDCHGDRFMVIFFSAGIAVFPDHATTMDTLLRIADTALYAAKAGGRNRVQYEPVSG